VTVITDWDEEYHQLNLSSKNSFQTDFTTQLIQWTSTTW